MKRNRLFLVLVLGVTAGVMAGLLALSYLRQQARPLIAAEAPKGKLVVAMKDLPLGSLLKPEDVRLIDWPAGALPAGFAATPEEVVGRGLITPVAANEPLLKTKLSTLEEGGGLPIVIPEGMRGVSVRVDQVVGVAGFVLPGTKVDVLVTIKPPEEGSSETPLPTTKMILQNVMVLTAGQIIQKDAEGKPQTVSVVTLLVTPEDGEKLVLAANEGRIQLALRNTLDLDSVTTRGIRTSAILGDVPPQRTVTRPVRVRPRGSGATVRQPVGGAVVETFRGGERTLKTFSPEQP